nr:hypothetical protein [Anaerolineae bacterium]
MAETMDSPWRLHLTSSVVIQLDILHGKQAVLAAWAEDGSVFYYDLQTGKELGKSKFALPKTDDFGDEAWKQFLPTLKGSKGVVLPRIRAKGGQVWTADNGLTAVIYRGGARLTHLTAADGKAKPYGFDVTPLALAVDPQTYTAAALDAEGALLVAKPDGTVKTVQLGLAPQLDLTASVKIARGAGRIALTDGVVLLVTDGAGGRLATRELSYACGLLALSQDGTRVLTYDSDSAVLRVYQADDLTLTHQRFVSDLMTTARTVKLFDDEVRPSNRAALSALTCDGLEHIAFAIMGHVCAASLEHLKLKNMSMIVPQAVAEAAPPVIAPSKPLPPAPVSKKASAAKAANKPASKPAAKAAKPAPVAPIPSPPAPLPLAGRGEKDEGKAPVPVVPAPVSPPPAPVPVEARGVQDKSQ